MKNTFRALRYPHYRTFWTGMLVAQVGSWMQSTAQSFLVYQLTGSALRTSLVMFCFTLPALFFSLPGGVIADRYERRRTVVVTQSALMTSAAVLAALTLAGIVEVWHILALAFANGIIMAIDIPSRQAMLPGLVAPEDLSNAIALNAALFNGSRIIGPALAGVIYRAAGPGWCFLLYALSLLAVIVPLARMRLPTRPGDLPVGVITQILDGLAYVRSHDAVRALIALLAAVATFGFAWVVVMPAFTVQVLRRGAVENGYLFAASGVGSTFGALLVASLRRIPRPGLLIAGSAALTGVMVIALGLTRVLPAALAVIAVMGFCLTCYMSSTNSTVQALVEDRYRGRVMSLYNLALTGSGPLGSLFAGWLADARSVPSSLAVNGALVLVLAALVYALAPALRRLDRAWVRLAAGRAAGARSPAAAARGPGS